MAYRGRPSKGCEPCRARKVKCDETKPACRRCLKGSHECRYRDQGDLLFRNQTAFAAQRAEDSWRKRAKCHQRTLSASSDSQQSPASESISPVTRTRQASTTDTIYEDHADYGVSISALSLVPELAPDLRRAAYERFLYDFVILEAPNRPPDEPSDSLWSFIPVLYERAAADSCVATIVDAVAYVNFANRCDAPHAEALGEECLGKATVLLSKMIADKRLARTDEALCSVYLMGVYENISSQQRQGTYIAHSNGANALVNMRSIEEFYSNPVSARLYEVAYSQMLLGNLHAGKPPPLPVNDALNVRQHLPSMYNQTGIFVMQLIHREARLHAKWHEIKQSAHPPTTRRDLSELLQAALDLDAQYQNWENNKPAIWDYSATPNTPATRATYPRVWQALILGARGAPQEIHAYPNLKRCWVWGFYRTSRMFLLRDLLEMLNWMARLPAADPLTNAPLPSHFASPFPLADQVAAVGFSRAALRAHRVRATGALVGVIEKSCSAILGSLTVEVYGKWDGDVMGMRGYINLWPLGIMDAVLCSGLVPDSSAVPTHSNHGYGRNGSVGSDTSTGYTITPIAALSPAPAVLSAPQTPLPVPDVLTQNMHHPYPPITRDPSLVAPRKTHIFDSSAPHYYDAPPGDETGAEEFEEAWAARRGSKDTRNGRRVSGSRHTATTAPTATTATTAPTATSTAVREVEGIDIPARRQWLNALLYYGAVELGIKKGLYVPVTEGWVGVVRGVVEGALGEGEGEGEG
ncbi:hypothetical protein C7974DRAFT_410787 [Boeremia exigua]|uniref:uncharacterized protein n=1 Tax=Boeremia exigua TaxID=749465 RepID=UPI001E8CB979|nr:uncharacterized protein C7974DRAFT_410787 [Boeremia exigua]KAH6639835.1 hypothetical protein C7974DRAFT_410787 [Boeremia exigua]